MYLLDTNVISEARKGKKANKGVINFFLNTIEQNIPTYLSVITIGELRRGIDKIRYRKDKQQAQLLEQWLTTLLSNYKKNILNFDIESAQLWGKLCSPNYENSIDKQILATAMTYNLKLVTRNTKHLSNYQNFLVNPFV